MEAIGNAARQRSKKRLGRAPQIEIVVDLLGGFLVRNAVEGRQGTQVRLELVGRLDSFRYLGGHLHLRCPGPGPAASRKREDCSQDSNRFIHVGLFLF